MTGQRGQGTASASRNHSVEKVGRYTETDPEEARPRTVRGRYIRRTEVVNSDPVYEGAYTDADSDPRLIEPDGLRGHYAEGSAVNERGRAGED